MKHSFALFFILALGCASCAQANAADGQLPVVRFELGDKPALVVTYQWPTACAGGLTFTSEDPRTNELQARALPATSGDLSPGISTLKLELPLSTAAGERNYPWAHPVGQGVYLYLPYYAMADNCGTPVYLLDAPGVMFLNGIEPGPISVSAEALKRHSAVLLRTAPQGSTRQRMYIDPALDEPITDALKQVFANGLTYFQANLPLSGFRQAGVVIGFTRDKSPVIGFGGDATNVIRLHHINLPEPLPPAMQQKIKLTLLHELAHRFHPESLANTPLYPLPGEGGADFLRWSAALATGLIGRAEAAEMFESALANCMQQTGTTPWQQLGKPERFGNRVPYDCGFVAYAIGLTMRQGKTTAMARVDEAFSSQARSDNFDFTGTLECGRVAACVPHWLPRMFGGKESVSQVVNDWVVQTGFMERMGTDTAANAPSQLPICANLAGQPPDPAAVQPSNTAPPCKPVTEAPLKLLYRVKGDRLLARLGL